MNFDIPQCYLHCKEIENKTITHDHFLQCKKLDEIQEHRIATINEVMLKSKTSVYESIFQSTKSIDCK